MYPKKKPEDEATVKLKKLSAAPENKRCFDCSQRGPTYINVTIGAFVCSTCGGLLRGLSTPHRIKSISMATFSSTEVQILEQHGNEVCKNIWLGRWSKQDPPTFDKNTENGRKDFLSDKYEKKLWYVNPAQASTKKDSAETGKSLKQIAEKQSSKSEKSASSPIAVARSRGTSVSSNKTPPLIKANSPAMPLPTMTRSTSLPIPTISQLPSQPIPPQPTPPQIPSQPNPPSVPKSDVPEPFIQKSLSNVNDLLGLESDPFSATATSATPNFANFDAFGLNNAAPVVDTAQRQPFMPSTGILEPQDPNKPKPATQQQVQSLGSANDRYAALADLDNTLRSMTFSGNETNPFVSAPKPEVTGVSNFNAFAPAQQHQTMTSSSNPFAQNNPSDWNGVNGVNHAASQPVPTQHGFPQGGVSVLNTQCIMSTGQQGPGAPTATPFGTFPAANSVGGPTFDPQYAAQMFSNQQQQFPAVQQQQLQQQQLQQQQLQQQQLQQQKLQQQQLQQQQQQQLQQQQFPAQQQMKQYLARQQQLLAAQMMNQQGIVSTDQSWNCQQQQPNQFLMQPNNPFNMGTQQTNPFT